MGAARGPVGGRSPVVREAGFTLVELLVASVVVAVLGAGAIRLFVVQTRAFRLQNEGVQATQNARAALELVAREVQNAGHDPRGLADAGITVWSADSLGWTADLDADGDLDGDDEEVLYYRDPIAATLVRRDRVGASVMLDGVEAVAFAYLADPHGTPAPTATAIEHVAITIEYRTPPGTPPGRLETRSALRNVIFR